MLRSNLKAMVDLVNAVYSDFHYQLRSDGVVIEEFWKLASRLVPNLEVSDIYDN